MTLAAATAGVTGDATSTPAQISSTGRHAGSEGLIRARAKTPYTSSGYLAVEALRDGPTILALCEACLHDPNLLRRAKAGARAGVYAKVYIFCGPSLMSLPRSVKKQE